MSIKSELIHLSPDDEPNLFYEKLAYIPEERLSGEILRFENYTWYATLLKFHQAALRRSDVNVRLTYNNRYGWHISSCLRSLPDAKDVYRDKCTCEQDISRPDTFFYVMQRDQIFRCKLCKRYVPDWEEIEGSNAHRPNPTEELEKESFIHDR